MLLQIERDIAVIAYLLDKKYTNNQEIIISQYCNRENVDDCLDSEFNLGNYDELIDLSKGATILKKHIQSKNKIAFLVDYDADGVSSGGISGLFMREYIGYSNYTIINNNRKFGNGVNDEIVRRVLLDKDIKLVISGDHGSNDNDRYKVLKEHNIDIIVTDHHMINDGNPSYADAFINPQRDGGNFNTYISGCATLFYLFVKTRQLLLKEDYPLMRYDELELLLPFVAMTTITDQMNLLDKLNRQLYKRGIEVMDRTKGLWWHIDRQLKLPKTFSTLNINFGFGSLFNAAGRMGNAKLATDVQISKSDVEIDRSVKELVELNRQRKLLQNELIGFGDRQLKQYMKRFKNTLIVVLYKGQGVGGIVAGMLGDKYNKPIFALNKIGDMLHGSGRGIVNNFNIRDVISYCKKKYPDMNISGGGHKGAAGCTFPYNDLMKFITAFEEYTTQQAEKPDNNVYYNLSLNTVDVTRRLFDELYKLEPYGMNFRPPKIKVNGVITKMFFIGKSKDHCIVKVNDLEIISFNVGTMFKGISKGDKVNMVITLGLKTGYRSNKEELSVVGEYIEKDFE